MAAAPTYAATPLLGSGLVPATADTSYTAPTNVTTLVTAGSNGSKITRIDLTPVGTVVAGVVNVFLYDGTNYHILSSVQINAATVSTTAAAATTSVTADDWVIPSGWSVRATNTVSGNQSLINVTVWGGSY